MRSWSLIGQAENSDVAAARLQLHWAAQVVPAAAAAHLEPRPDDSHRNLGWSDEFCALASHPLGPSEVRLALRPETLSLHLLDESGQDLSSLELDGATLDDAHAWAGAQLTERASLPAKTLTRVEYELPAHPIAAGQPFKLDDAGAFAELAHLYQNAHAALEAVSAEHGGAAVRIWPHHFDIATLIALDASPDPETARSIGVGMTPGDGGIPTPYFYVTPWPYPSPEALGELESRGSWNTEGWTGAVLRLDEILSQDAAQQATWVRDFLRSAVQGSRTALER